MTKKNNSVNSHSVSTDKELVIIGIGSSAGGLEALRSLVSGLPAQDNITYVIAQPEKMGEKLPDLISDPLVIPEQINGMNAADYLARIYRLLLNQTGGEELTAKTAEVEAVNERLKLLNRQLEAEVKERSKAEQEISQQKEKLHTIIASEPAWVNVCDSNGTIMEVNPAGIDIMEAGSEAELIGRQLLDFVSPDYKELARDCRANLELGKTNKHMIEVKTLKGNIRWLEISTVLLPSITGNSDGSSVMSIICDQTQYKLAQQALIQRQEELSEAMRLTTLGAMASGLAHELNQPLSAITNYINGCERRVRNDSCEREEVLDALGLASMQAQRAGDIINNVKRFIKQDNFESEVICINECIYNAIELSHETGQSGSVKFTLVLSESLPKVLSSKLQIEQVLINLMRNGIEAMEGTGVDEPELIIVSEYSEKEGFVTVSVKDSGKGLSTEELNKIFKPFHTTKQMGMGMGLCISRSIIEMYTGNFTVENSEEGGAVFSFSLPAHQYNQGS